MAFDPLQWLFYAAVYVLFCVLILSILFPKWEKKGVVKEEPSHSVDVSAWPVGETTGPDAFDVELVEEGEYVGESALPLMQPVDPGEEILTAIVLDPDEGSALVDNATEVPWLYHRLLREQEAGVLKH